MSQAGSKQEIEIKLPVPDAAAAQRLVLDAGFTVSVPRVFEANTVYDTPDNSLSTRGMLLRLRRAGERYTLTVKGQALSGKHKAREEDEVTVSDYDTSQVILSKLGYLPMFRYEKYRTEFSSTAGPGTITLDETPIGAFLELEGTPEWIDSTARVLRFTETQYVVDSYGKLYLAHCREAGKVPTNMVFDS